MKFACYPAFRLENLQVVASVGALEFWPCLLLELPAHIRRRRRLGPACRPLLNAWRRIVGGASGRPTRSNLIVPLLPLRSSRKIKQS